MTTQTRPDLSTLNGPGLAAVLAAGIGSFAMGALVLANEAGVFAAPALYPPAGGLSGRSTFAVLIWLVAWGALHARWRLRSVSATAIVSWTLLLIAAGLIATFPPVWGLL